MVIVSAKIKTKPGKRDDFIKAAESVIAATRAEAGCLKYELYASTEDADGLMYYEEWHSRAALEEHMKAPHLTAFKKLREERGLIDGAADVRIFDVSVSGS